MLRRAAGPAPGRTPRDALLGQPVVNVGQAGVQRVQARGRGTT